MMVNVTCGNSRWMIGSTSFAKCSTASSFGACQKLPMKTRPSRAANPDGAGRDGWMFGTTCTGAAGVSSTIAAWSSALTASTVSAHSTLNRSMRRYRSASSRMDAFPVTSAPRSSRSQCMSTVS
jgi:hypothetical protein